MNDSIKEKIAEWIQNGPYGYPDDDAGRWMVEKLNEACEFGVSLMESEVSELKAERDNLKTKLAIRTMATVEDIQEVRLAAFELADETTQAQLKEQSEEIASLKAVLGRARKAVQQCADEELFDGQEFGRLCREIDATINLNSKSL